MSKATPTKHDEALDEQTLQLLGDAPATLDTSPQRMKSLRDRVMQRVQDDNANVSQSFITVRPQEGSWVEIIPRIKKKVLFLDPETSIESFLLRIEPGGKTPTHLHEMDEHCLVLEGELSFGEDIHLQAGDYHFAPKGSEHGSAYSELGAVLYIQMGHPGIQAHC